MIAYYNNSFLKLFNQILEIKKAPYKSSSLCFNIQLILINKIRYIEKKIRYWKEKAKGNENEEGKKIFIQKCEEYKVILLIFKEIGDCLAYIYINRWDIKPISFNHTPGFISDKKGFQLEYKIFKGIAKIEIPCILADLTNVLRHGDIYVFKEECLLPFIFEVKTNKKSDRRSRRQKRRLNNLSEYLTKDKTSELFGKEITAIRVEPKEHDYYHLDVLNKSIQKAYEKGHVITQTENGLYYVVDTLGNVNIFEEVISRCKEPFIVFSNENEFNKCSYPYYPIILSMHTAKSILDLYHGNLLIFVVIDLDIVYKHFKAKGVNYKLSDENDYMFDLWLNEYSDWQAKGFDIPIRISKNFWAKVGYEFLSLEWILKHIIERVFFISKELTKGGKLELGNDLGSGGIGSA